MGISRLKIKLDNTLKGNAHIAAAHTEEEELGALRKTTVDAKVMRKELAELKEQQSTKDRQTETEMAKMNTILTASNEITKEKEKELAEKIKMIQSIKGTVSALQTVLDFVK